MRTDRRDLRRRLVAIAGSQGGYFTAAQAKAAGYSYQAQAYHREAGNWEQVDRATYRLPEWPPNMHDDLIRWTFWSGSRGVISYETALATHELGEFEAPHIHMTVPLGFRKDHDALMLHKAKLPDRDVEVHDGYRITTVVRSLIDVASLAPDTDQLARAIDEALDRGRVTLKRLRTEAERVSTRGALFIERAIPFVIERR